MAYDPACHDLATVFLGAASERLKAALAQHIQDSVEDWLRIERDRLAAALGSPPPEGRH